MIKLRFLLISLILLTFALVASAQNKYLLSPMPGYTENVTKEMAYANSYYFNETFFCSTRFFKKLPCSGNDPGFDDFGKFIAEGQVTHIKYKAKDQESDNWPAAFDNYKSAIKKAGGKEIAASKDYSTHIYLIDKPQPKMWIVLFRYNYGIYEIEYIQSKSLQQSVSANDKLFFSPMPGYSENVDIDLEYAAAKYSDLFYRDCSIENHQPKPCSRSNPGFDEKGRFVAEGKYTRVSYEAQKKDAASWLEVFHNYDTAIKKVGGIELTASILSPTDNTDHIYLIDRPQAKMWILLRNLGGPYSIEYIQSNSMQQSVTENKKHHFSPMAGYSEKVTKKMKDAPSRLNGNVMFYCSVVNDRPLPCSSNDPGFDEKGYFVAKGKFTQIEYQAKKNTHAAGELAIFRNYDNAIKKAGGKELTASYFPQSERAHIYLIEKPQAKMWIILSLFGDSAYAIEYIET